MLSRRAFAGLFLLPGVVRSQDLTPSMFGNAEAYERFMGRWSRLVATPLIDFARLPEEGRMLDFGSGTGSLAFAIAGEKPGVRITGIDPSKEYVDYAKSRNRFPDRTSFEIGDAQQLQFPDAAFEASLSLLVMNFIPDPGKALSEVRRVTKPGGAVAAAVWDYGDGMRMLRVFWDAAGNLDPAAEKLDEKHMPLCRAGELSELWTLGGLKDVREQPIEITMHFPSFRDYWDVFLLGQGPAGAYAAGLDPDRRLALRNELKRHLSLGSEDARLVMPARVWAVRGSV